MTATPFTIEVCPSQYFQPTTLPKFALGQLVKTCLDQYSNCTDVVLISALTLDNDGDWQYGCTYLTRIKVGDNPAIFDQGEKLVLDDQGLDPLTDEDKLYVQELLSDDEGWEDVDDEETTAIL